MSFSNLQALMKNYTPPSENHESTEEIFQGYPKLDIVEDVANPILEKIKEPQNTNPFFRDDLPPPTLKEIPNFFEESPTLTKQDLDFLGSIGQNNNNNKTQLPNNEELEDDFIIVSNSPVINEKESPKEEKVSFFSYFFPKKVEKDPREVAKTRLFNGIKTMPNLGNVDKEVQTPQFEELKHLCMSYLYADDRSDKDRSFDEKIEAYTTAAKSLKSDLSLESLHPRARLLLSIALVAPMRERLEQHLILDVNYEFHTQGTGGHISLFSGMLKVDKAVGVDLPEIYHLNYLVEQLFGKYDQITETHENFIEQKRDLDKDNPEYKLISAKIETLDKAITQISTPQAQKLCNIEDRRNNEIFEKNEKTQNQINILQQIYDGPIPPIKQSLKRPFQKIITHITDNSIPPSILQEMNQKKPYNSKDENVRLYLKDNIQFLKRKLIK